MFGSLYFARAQRIPFLPGLGREEKANFEVIVEIATHSGIPFSTLATQGVMRNSIRLCWAIIRRREMAGKVKKEQWLKNQNAKEEAKRLDREWKLNEAREKQKKIELENQLRGQNEKLSAEEAEANKRLQARLDKEIEDMAKLEGDMSRLEREKMHREEMRQKVRKTLYPLLLSLSLSLSLSCFAPNTLFALRSAQGEQALLQERRKRSRVLEISHMEHEDRAGHDLIISLQEAAELRGRQDVEKQKREERNKGGGGGGEKRHKKIRFHR